MKKSPPRPIEVWAGSVLDSVEGDLDLTHDHDADNETVEREGLGKRQGDDHRGLNLSGSLWVAGDALECSSTLTTLTECSTQCSETDGETGTEGNEAPEVGATGGTITSCEGHGDEGEEAKKEACEDGEELLLQNRRRRFQERGERQKF